MIHEDMAVAAISKEGAADFSNLDDEGQLQDFITSGLTAEGHQRFIDLPRGPEFFAYLSSRPNRSGSRTSPSTPHRWGL